MTAMSGMAALEAVNRVCYETDREAGPIETVPCSYETRLFHCFYRLVLFPRDRCLEDCCSVGGRECEGHVQLAAALKEEKSAV